MKAMVSRRYGLGGLRLEEVPEPVPGEGEVLVRMEATSINFAMLCRVTGTPLPVRLLKDGFLKPRFPVPGGELAGVVTATGGGVTRFKPGDEVYGDCCAAGYGASAEYLRAPESALCPMPANLSFVEAAALPQSALVALQALVAGGIGEGKKVLVHGASGGIGTLAVQVAAAFGARVTGVCSGANAALVLSLGADRVIDYRREDFAADGPLYDIVLAIRGNRSMEDYARALVEGGSFVLVGGDWAQVLGATLGARRILEAGGRRLARFAYAVDAEDLALLAGLAEAGKLRPVIDSVHPLEELAEALRRYREGHARGKIVVRIRRDGSAERKEGKHGN